MLKRFFPLFRDFDWVLFASVAILVLFGLAGIGSVGLSREPVDFLFLRKQAVFLVLGLLVMFAFAFAHPTRWRFATPAIYLFSVLLLAGVLIFGLTVRGMTGWFSIAGLRVQPVEIAKVALILVFAKYAAEHLFWARQWKIFLRTGLLLLLPAILILLQPDAGSASVLIILWLGILFAVGIRRSHLFIILSGAAILAISAWFLVLAPYQKDRLLTLVNPDRDPLGSGYNVTQSLIAVGSGKFFGRGLGFGAQSQMKFLPESQTDFIFAVLAEELGFAAVSVILLAFAVFFKRAIGIARRIGDPYAQFVAIGIVIVIFYEMFVNIGMNVGLMPVTGITLPFVSYGGSSLLAHMAMLGLLEGIAMHSVKRVEEE